MFHINQSISIFHPTYLNFDQKHCCLLAEKSHSQRVEVSQEFKATLWENHEFFLLIWSIDAPAGKQRVGITPLFPGQSDTQACLFLHHQAVCIVKAECLCNFYGSEYYQVVITILI